MLKGWRLSISKVFIIPQRYVLAIMGLFAIANSYTMRVCLNLAITQMVKKSGHANNGHFDPDVCVAQSTKTFLTNTSIHSVEQETVLFEWSEATQGLLLSAFYYGYVLTHIPGGMLAERFGGKWVLGCGLLSTAICTVATPLAVRHGGATALFILRVIEGLGEGPAYPGLSTMLSRWSPKAERGRIGAIVFGGAQIGNIAGIFLSGMIMHNGVWDNVFYLFGGIGVLWFLLWSLLCYSTPNTHPYISEEEKIFLNENVVSLSNKEKLDPVPWKAFFRSVPMWALTIAAIGHDWGYFTMVTDLPKYMTDVLKFNIKSTATLASVPYISMWIASFMFGIVCDFCVRSGYHSIGVARKIYTTIAAAGPGICILLASYSGCNTTAAVVWFVVAMSLMGAYYSGMRINTLDITPNYAGTTTAFINGIAATSGIISPYLIGLLTPDSTLKQWRVAFWVCFAVLVITNIVFVIWGEGEQLWWDDVKKHGYPTNWKHGPLPSKLNIDSEMEKNNEGKAVKTENENCKDTKAKQKT